MLDLVIFETQTLLNVIQSRQSGDKKTIIVSPSVDRLVTSGSGNGINVFFESLKQILNSTKVGTVTLE